MCREMGSSFTNSKMLPGRIKSTTSRTAPGKVTTAEVRPPWQSGKRSLSRTRILQKTGRGPLQLDHNSIDSKPKPINTTHNMKKSITLLTLLAGIGMALGQGSVVNFNNNGVAVGGDHKVYLSSVGNGSGLVGTNYVAELY